MDIKIMAAIQQHLGLSRMAGAPELMMVLKVVQALKRHQAALGQAVAVVTA
jgi:hypothetical protein